MVRDEQVRLRSSIVVVPTLTHTAARTQHTHASQRSRSCACTLRGRSSVSCGTCLIVPGSVSRALYAQKRLIAAMTATAVEEEQVVASGRRCRRDQTSTTFKQVIPPRRDYAASQHSRVFVTVAATSQQHQLAKAQQQHHLFGQGVHLSINGRRKHHCMVCVALLW